MDTLIHDLQDITIRRISVSEMDNNVYLLTAKASGAQLLIDAADDLPAIQGLLRGRRRGYRGNAQAGADRHHPPALGPRPGAAGTGGSDRCADRGRNGRRRGAAGAGGCDAGSRGYLRLGRLRADGSAPARAHTGVRSRLCTRTRPGPAHIFSGDSLFPGGVGNTQKDPARFSQLINDVSERLFDAYPDDTVVHPGHGKPHHPRRGTPAPGRVARPRLVSAVNN